MTAQPITPTPELGLHKGISNADYHAGPGYSSSQLKEYSHCPLKFWGKYISDEAPPRVETDSMRFGTAYHTAILEPELFDQEIAVAPEVNRRTKAGKEEWELFMSLNAGKTVIKSEDYALIEAMRERLYSNAHVRSIIEGRQHEVSGYFKDPETGLMLKYRPDIRDDSFIADLKTTQSAAKTDFSRDVAKYGYHQSAAHYLDGDANLTESSHETFIFIAQEKTFPFAYCVYPIGMKSLEQGRRENRKAIDGINNSLLTNEWPSYEPSDIEIPGWAMHTAANDEDY